MQARKTLGVFFLLVPAAFAQTPAPQQQLNQTMQALAKTKENDAALLEKQARLRNELGQLQTHATELAERLQVSERRVSNEEKALGETNARLAAKQKEFDARQADYVATITTLLRMRDLPVTALFSSPNDVRQLMQTATILEKTNIAAAQKARRLAQDMQELQTLKSDAASRRARTATETQALNNEQVQLEKSMRARQALQAQLSADHAHAEEKIASLSRESETLQGLINKLDAEARAQQARAKQTPLKAKPARKLENAKGSLRPPVSGELVHRYGDRKSGNETYRGNVYRARAGSTVVAPYDGEVVFTGPFRDYGTMLLIKHQNGYISLIAGLGNVTAGLNQTVIKGEPVATMPADKNSEAYVELRDSDAKPIDPGVWFANVGPVATQK